MENFEFESESPLQNWNFSWRMAKLALHKPEKIETFIPELYF